MSNAPRRSPPLSLRISYFLAYLLLGVILVLLLGYAISGPFLPFKPTPLMMLTLAGAFGGLAYAIRDRKLELPRVDPLDEYTIHLGLLADCFAGIAGAYIVFLVVPLQTDRLGTVEGDVRLLATGILGGYGGRSLVNQVLGGLVRQDVERLKEQVSLNQNLIAEVKDQSRLDAEALALLHRQLDPKITPSSSEVEDLKRLIIAASPSMKVHVFTQTSGVRNKNWRSNKPLMERTIPIFEALIEGDSEDQFHRNHGELGAALKDKVEPNWTGAEAEINRAIEIRNRQSKTGFSWYEFNRAICRIMTDPDYQKGKPSSLAQLEKILRDLQIADKEFHSIANLVATEPNHAISEWLRVNHISAQTLERIA